MYYVYNISFSQQFSKCKELFNFAINLCGNYKLSNWSMYHITTYYNLSFRTHRRFFHAEIISFRGAVRVSSQTSKMEYEIVIKPQHYPIVFALLREFCQYI